MRTPKQWLDGFQLFKNARIKNMRAVPIEFIEQLKLEYIGLIQKDAQYEKTKKKIRKS